MQKILVLGSYGAGKTIFSNELSSLLKIPVYHLDQYYWLPDWTIPPLKEWIEINKKLITKEKWIIDGNYLKTIDIRIYEADLIIYLEANKWLCIYRVLKRTLLNLGKSRVDMPDKCNDRFNFNFLISVLFFNYRTKPKIIQKIKNNNCQQKLIIHNSDAKKFYFKYLNCLET